MDSAAGFLFSMGGNEPSPAGRSDKLSARERDVLGGARQRELHRADRSSSDHEPAHGADPSAQHHAQSSRPTPARHAVAIAISDGAIDPLR